MSSAITGSAALTDLQNNLKKLSAQLHDISTMMNTDMTKIGDVWQDGKYQEFMEAYKPQIQNCQHISERYDGWCTNVLQPTIDNVIEVEKTDVSFDGGTTGASVGGGTSAGTASGVASQSGTAAQSPSIGKNFNLGGNSSTLGAANGTLGATKNNPLSSSGGNPTYGNLSEEQRIEDWEKKNGMSLDRGRLTIDENGKAVPRTNLENGAGSMGTGNGINSGIGNSASPSAEGNANIGNPTGSIGAEGPATTGKINPDAQKIVDVLDADKKADKGSAGTENVTAAGKIDPDAQKIVDTLNKGKAEGTNEGVPSTSPQASQEDGAMLKHLREEASDKSSVNNAGSNVVDNPAPSCNIPEEERIKRVEEEKQMSLDRDRFTVDDKGNIVPRPQVEATGSTSLEDWKNDVLQPSAPNSGNEPGAMSSQILEYEKAKETNPETWKEKTLEPSAPNPGNELGVMTSQILEGKEVTGIQSGGDTTIATSEETKVFVNAPHIEHTHTHEEQTNVFVDNSVTETKIEHHQNVTNVTNITNVYCNHPEHHNPAPADVQAQPESSEIKPNTDAIPFPEPAPEPEPKPIRRVVPRPVYESAPAPEPEPAPEPRPRPVPPRHRPSYVHNDPTPRPVRPDPRGPDYDHTPNPRPNPRVHHSIPEDSPRPNNQHNSVSAPPRRPSPIRPLGKGSRAR